MAKPSSADLLRAAEEAFRRGLPAPPPGTTLDARGNFRFTDRSGRAFDSHTQASLRRAYDGRGSAVEQRRLETLRSFGVTDQGVPRGHLTREGWEAVRFSTQRDADLTRDYADLIDRRRFMSPQEFDRALARFRGIEVVDIYGRRHRFLTDRGVLAQLDRAGELQPPPRAFGGSP